jgi:nucleotide-binding universal stress UspA family protein
MFDKLLVAVDGSECSLKATRVAAEIARKFGSTVTAVHAIYLPATIAAAAGAAGMVGNERALEALEEAATEILGSACETLGLPGEQVKQEVLHAHPAEAICRWAEEGKSDLIVMGSRGLSEIRAFFLGSVSDKVSHHAHCPVLIVR